jgi:hypothetical protein
MIRAIVPVLLVCVFLTMNAGHSRQGFSLVVVSLAADEGEPARAADLAPVLASAFSARGFEAVPHDARAVGLSPSVMTGKADAALFTALSAQVTHVVVAETIASSVRGGGPDDAALMTVRLYLYSVSDREFVYVTDEAGAQGTLGELAATLAARTHLFLAGELPLVAALSPSPESAPDALRLTWQCSRPDARYEIGRSIHRQGPFEQIGEAGSPEFVDSGAMAGRVYYYRVRGLVNGVAGDPSETARAFIRVPEPRGEDLDALLKARNAKEPVIADPGEKALVERDLAVVKEFYVNLFSVNFILNIIKKYIKEKQVIALSDMGEYFLDRSERTAYLVYPGRCVVKFYSGRLFRLYNQCPPTAEPLVLTFGAGGNAAGSMGKGWAQPDEQFTWTLGETAEIEFPAVTGGTGVALDVYLARVMHGGPVAAQRVLVSVNERSVGFFRAKEKGRYSFLIPAEAVSSDQLLSIRLDLPDSVAPSQLNRNSSDGRLLALAVEKIEAYPYAQERDLFRRLMANSVVFALPTAREMEISLADGSSMILPVFDGAGMATQYYHNSAQWKKSTLLFDSSDREIQDKLKDAARKARGR